MSNGDAIIIAVLSAMVALYALQWAVAQRARVREGSPVPAVVGELSEALRRDGILWFHSPDCAPSIAMLEAVQALEDEGKALLVDVSTHPEVAEAFHVTATPTTMRIHDGHVHTIRRGALRIEDLHGLA